MENEKLENAIGFIRTKLYLAEKQESKQIEIFAENLEDILKVLEDYKRLIR